VSPILLSNITHYGLIKVLLSTTATVRLCAASRST